MIENAIIRLIRESMPEIHDPEQLAAAVERAADRLTHLYSDAPGS